MTSILNNSRRPDITVNISGRIDITSRIVKLLNMQAGDVVDVCQHGVEYFLYVRRTSQEIVGRHEGLCFPTSRGGRGSYRTWSVRLAKALRDVCGKEDYIVRFPCGEAQVIDEKIYVPIIVRNPL
ncbi:MAG: hypothetical protein HDS77_06905 [Bacteroidales bacterium]|nr:hypothetical protein [Bacteroidales bacterium]